MPAEDQDSQEELDPIATLLVTSIAGGADLKTVMERLGHTQIQTTQKYLHALPGADDLALAAYQRTRGDDRRSEAQPRGRSSGTDSPAPSGP